jgi:hypothetical protein
VERGWPSDAGAGSPIAVVCTSACNPHTAPSSPPTAIDRLCVICTS